ncbi:hypothetical protein SpCBS45565_g03203 [Spizellomyces sp. 'palustris']|nr:hypothetical protein SpCBS45565_g03203 [Spizellomyces sp. 'palustris']
MISTVSDYILLLLFLVAWRWGTWLQVGEVIAWWVFSGGQERAVQVQQWSVEMVERIRTRARRQGVSVGMQTEVVEIDKKASGLPARFEKIPAADKERPFSVSGGSLIAPAYQCEKGEEEKRVGGPRTYAAGGAPMWDVDSSSDSNSTLVNPDGDVEWKEAVGVLAAIAAAAADKQDQNSQSLLPSSVKSEQVEVEEDKDAELLSFTQKIRQMYGHDPLLKTFSDAHISKFVVGSGAFRTREEDAIKALESTLEWRRKNDYDSLFTEDFSDIERTHKLYFHPHQTKDGLPILVWRAARHVMCKDEHELQRTVRYLISVVEKAKKSGKLDTRLTLLISRMDILPQNKDPALLKLLLSTFQTHYPDHLERLYIFPKTMLLTIGWNVAKVFLSSDVRGRVEILGGDWREVVRREVGVDGLGEEAMESKSNSIKEKGKEKEAEVKKRFGVKW